MCVCVCVRVLQLLHTPPLCVSHQKVSTPFTSSYLVLWFCTDFSCTAADMALLALSRLIENVQEESKLQQMCAHGILPQIFRLLTSSASGKGMCICYTLFIYFIKHRHMHNAQKKALHSLCELRTLTRSTSVYTCFACTRQSATCTHLISPFHISVNRFVSFSVAIELAQQQSFCWRVWPRCH